MAGSWNADIYPPLKEMVKDDDVHCAKNRMSGLWSEEQPLWRYLDGKDGGKGKGKRTLLFTGVNTDQCVLGTLVNAYNAGWDCVMIDDCCATTTPYGREVCVQNIGVRSSFLSLFHDSFCFFNISLTQPISLLTLSQKTKFRFSICLMETTLPNSISISLMNIPH